MIIDFFHCGPYVNVILYNAQYHTNALISYCAKEKISEQARVIAGKPEATLRVSNKIRPLQFVFMGHLKFSFRCGRAEFSNKQQ